MLASEWIDRCKKESGIETDNQIAIALGLSRQAVSNMRQKRTLTLSNATVIRVANLLDIDVGQVLLDQAMESAKSAMAGRVTRSAMFVTGALSAAASAIQYILCQIGNETSVTA